MPRLSHVVILALSLACGGAHRPAAASDPIAERRAVELCERAIVEGARRGGVPETVLHAIALTETGRLVDGRMRPWPWAVNREGQGYWFDSREAALAFAQASVAEGRTSFDVGCFQINYRWHGDKFASLEAMFDQTTNGTYAASFLRTLQAELGSWSAAAGAYHSRTPDFAERYRARFDRIYAGLDGAPLVVAAEGPETVEGPPRKSRTRMGAKPKIISLGAGAPALAKTAAAVRIERGKVPQSVLRAEAEAATATATMTDGFAAASGGSAPVAEDEATRGPRPLILSTRDTPL